MRPRGKFTLLFMHDSGKVYRFRFGRAVPAFLLLVVCLFTLAGAAGVWACLAWLEERRTWQGERGELLTLLNQDRVVLERLTARLEQLEKAAEQKIEEGPAEQETTTYQTSINRQVVSIRETSFVQVDGRTLRIVLDMYNARPPRPLAGRIMFSLRTADERVLPLIHEDTRFDIIRFRKFDLTATLPPAVTDMRNASVILEVLVKGEVVFRDNYLIK